MNTMRLGDLKVNTAFMWKTLLCRKVSSNSWTYCVVDGQEFMLPNSTIVEVQDRQFSDVKPGDFFTYEGEDFIKTNIIHKFGGHVLGGALRVLAPKGSEKRMELFFPTKKVQECTTNYKDF